MCLFKIRLFENLVLIVVVRISYDRFEENDFPVKVYSSGGKRCFMQMETERKLGSCTSIRQNRLENKRDGDKDGHPRVSQKTDVCMHRHQGGTPKCRERVLTDPKGETSSNVVTVGDFNVPLTSVRKP